MRVISEQELKNILDKHGKWLRNEENGERANLRYANLRSADLRSADLRYANLRYANLRSADLRSADLRSADLRSADLVIFQFQRHTAYYTFDGSLIIGCHVLPITEWAETFEQIGIKEQYTPLQIKIYGQFIMNCLQLFKEIPNEKQ